MDNALDRNLDVLNRTKFLAPQSVIFVRSVFRDYAWFYREQLTSVKVGSFG